MWGYFFLIVFLVFFVYSTYKWGSFVISDLICGFVLLLVFTSINFKGNENGKEETLLVLFNLISYIPLFISSLFIYFDKENEKRAYYIFPILVYLVLIIIEKQTIDYSHAWVTIYLPIAGAFFPLYFLNYYKKYIKDGV
ncbi:hypothetical protein ACFFLS_00945 [Flavobacterium procerum]|uniref:Uncharacterized protein n=1 Tax=Flavobacterium procerum TaxID=1455569 RepID=A0ABV6BJG0_9FLAO